MNKKIQLSIKAARVNAGYSVNEIAEKLGCSAPMVSLIESGKRNISPQNLNKLLSLYGISRENIFLP